MRPLFDTYSCIFIQPRRCYCYKCRGTSYVKLSTLTTHARVNGVPNLINGNLDFKCHQQAADVIVDDERHASNSVFGHISRAPGQNRVISLSDGQSTQFSFNNSVSHHDSTSSTVFVLDGSSSYGDAGRTPSINSLSPYSRVDFDELGLPQAPMGTEIDIEHVGQLMSDIELDGVVDSDAGSNESDVSETSDDRHNTFCMQLRQWNYHANVARAYMNELLQLLRENGHDKFPRDWRTQERRCDLLENLLKGIPNCASVTDVEVVLVCGSCFLSSFSTTDVLNAIPCSNCHVTRLRCSRPRCLESCILTSSLGNRTVASLTPCPVCLTDAETSVIHRTFRFPLANYVKAAFANRELTYQFMAPFKNFCHLGRESPTTNAELFCVPAWHDNWIRAMRTVSYCSELWHGAGFFNHAIWKESGPRSLLLMSSLDWFPPFKQRDYSIGVLSVTPMNLTCSERASRNNTWILAVLEGPKEPDHIYHCLAPSFRELRLSQDVGIEVYDAATRSNIIVHLSMALVCADVPACAKLGNHVGHSSYEPCISCEYIGCLCGCKSILNEPSPAQWQNHNHRPGQSVRKYDGQLRKGRTGEHIVFVDVDILMPHHLRSESKHRQGIALVTALLETCRTNAELVRAKKKTKCSGPSVLTLLHPNHFSFISGFALDSMHSVIKGTFARLWFLTMNKKWRGSPFSVISQKGGLISLQERFSKFKFPVGTSGATRFVTRCNSLKAEQLYVIIRICGPFIFNKILPRKYVVLWAIFCKLYTNIMHFHVNRMWMTSESGFIGQLRQALTLFQEYYGKCHLPSNFHRLLHCVLDFQQWGNLRSHWAFPMERVYGALMTHTQHQNRAQATVSVVNAIPRMYSCDNSESASVMGRILNKCPEFVMNMSAELRQIIDNRVFVWVNTFFLKNSRRWHTGEWLAMVNAGESVSTQSFYFVAGILASRPDENSEVLTSTRRNESEALFVLRKVTALKTRRFFAESSVFHYLSAADISTRAYLGEQVIRNPASVYQNEVALCAVVEYRLENEDVVLIPSCGNVCWD